MADPAPSPRVLLVEDNPLHARLVVSMLEEVWPGLTLLQARTLDVGRRLLAEQAPDCVLLDLVLPDADGLEAVAAMLDEDPDAAIVVLSSHDDDGLALAAVAAGAEDYLVKGTVDAAGVARAITFAVERSRRGRRAPPSVSAFDPGARAGAGSLIGTTIVDRDGIIRYLDEAVAEMVGRPAGELVGWSVVALCHPDDTERWWGAFDRAVAGTHEPNTILVRIRHESGHDIRVTVAVEPLEGASGKVEAFLVGYHPHMDEGTAASGGVFVVMSGLTG